MRRPRLIFWPLAMLALCSATLALFVVASGESAAEPRFDHLTTGFRLEGAHLVADCESCHSDGLFAGTPTDCVGCHAQANRIRATWKPQTHLQTTDRCDSCHRPHSWVPVARFDHFETQTSCSSCHNNRIVAGQHPQHIPTTEQCDSCHNTRFWR